MNAERSVVSFRTTHLPPPSRNSLYQIAREFARADRLEPELRWFCALLEAPSDLRCIDLVARNLRDAISVVPDDWNATLPFTILDRVAVWIDANSDQIRPYGSVADAVPSGKSGHEPMHGCRESFPLYTMMCQTQQDPGCQAAYRWLQLQVLDARNRELQRHYADDLSSYIDSYEEFDPFGEKDRISDKIRFTKAVASHVRLLRTRAAAKLVDFMQPEVIPITFASTLLRRIEGGVPYGPYFGKRAREIAQYCKDSSARQYAPRSSHERSSARSDFHYGYVEYSPRVIGMYLDSPDPDDHELIEPEHECLLIRTVAPETAEQDDEHPDEAAVLGLIATDVTASRNGVSPEQMARARASVLRLEIDRESLPWSAGQLRPAEIATSLLTSLRRIAVATHFDSEQAREELEIAALAAVCLETGRLPEHVLQLPVGEDPKGNFSIIHQPRADDPLLWSWKAIEPAMKSPHVFIDGQEASRAHFIANPIRTPTQKLISSLIQLSGPRWVSLFSGEGSAYNDRVRSWLKTIDGDRLTIGEISKMQWSILAQLTANNYVAASMALGIVHQRARVPLFYALMPVAEAQQLFQTGCRRIWGEDLTDVGN